MLQAAVRQRSYRPVGEGGWVAKRRNGKSLRESPRDKANHELSCGKQTDAHVCKGHKEETPNPGPGSETRTKNQR